jgi:hypothetical protein
MSQGLRVLVLAFASCFGSSLERWGYRIANFFLMLHNDSVYACVRERK